MDVQSNGMLNCDVVPATYVDGGRVVTNLRGDDGDVRLGMTAAEARELASDLRMMAELLEKVQLLPSKG